VGEGQATQIERIAKAKAKRFEELVTLYTTDGAFTRDRAVEMANAMINNEFNAEAISKLTGTYVAGGVGVQLGIQGGGKQ
jgi:hypothetical protein